MSKTHFEKLNYILSDYFMLVYLQNVFSIMWNSTQGVNNTFYSTFLSRKTFVCVRERTEKKYAIKASNVFPC